MTAVDFELPKELEAREPAELRGSGRDDVKLLVTTSDSVTHAHFRDLPRFLKAGDLLVLNTTATLPAALSAIRNDGDVIALHVSTPLPGGLVVVEPRGGAGGRQQAAGGEPRGGAGGRQQAAGGEPRGGAGGGQQAAGGEPRGGAGGRQQAAGGDDRPFLRLPPAARRLRLPGNASVTLLAPYRDSQRLWIARFAMDMPLREYLLRFGRPITYSYVDRRFPLDAYQTVYAREPGSAEMPSAGRAFTRPMLACLRRRGVRLAKLVLHAGVASLETHERPYEEYFEVPRRTADEVRRAKERGGRVVAVGTTVVRALESAVGVGGNVIAARGWTELVITPERGVRVVDGLLTGLHEPRATHLAMLEAIAGRAHVQRAYAAALERRYLWHEFGDLHLIL